MKILELISNPANNRLSHSKLWASAACVIGESHHFPAYQEIYEKFGL